MEVKQNSQTESGCVEYAGNYTFVPCGFGGNCLSGRSWGDHEPKFAMRALGPQTLSELEFLSRFSGQRKAPQGFCRVEVRGCVELRGNMPEDSALEGGGLGGQASNVESDAFGGC